MPMTMSWDGVTIGRPDAGDRQPGHSTDTEESVRVIGEFEAEMGVELQQSRTGGFALGGIAG